MLGGRGRVELLQILKAGYQYLVGRGSIYSPWGSELGYEVPINEQSCWIQIYQGGGRRGV